MRAKVEINYSKTPITFYRIFYLDDNNFNYVGSTTNIKRRTGEHKSRIYDKNCKDYPCKLYQTVRNTGGFTRWVFVVLDQLICTDKKDRLLKEKNYIKQFNCSKCNNNIPIITDDERQLYKRTYQHNYYMKNKQIKSQQELYLMPSLHVPFLQAELTKVEQQVQLPFQHQLVQQ